LDPASLNTAIPSCPPPSIRRREIPDGAQQRKDLLFFGANRFDAGQLLRTRGKMINFRRFSRLFAASFVVVASFGGAAIAQGQAVISGRVTDEAGRSEERRVGNGCRPWS